MKIFPVCKEWKNSPEQCPIPIWNFLSRDSKFQILQTTQKRIQNFWSPKNTMKDFEFMILKEHNEGFRISDPQIPQERIQYFSKDSEFLIPYNDTQKDSEFLIPYKDTKVFRISDPPKNTEEDSEFLIYRGTLAGKGFRISHLSPIEQDSQHFLPKEHSLEWNRNSWSPKQPKWKKDIFLSGLKAVTKSVVKIITEGFWGKLKTDYKFHHINFIQSPV